MNIVNRNKFEFKKGAVVDYLQSLGVEKVDSFLYKPSVVDYENPRTLHNNLRLVKEMHKAIEDNKKFFIMVDSDTDGITSSAIFYNYFKARYPYISFDYAMHENKEHGIILELVDEEIDVVVIPDAGSNQYEEIGILTDGLGKKVFILDHHKTDKEIGNNNCILVNNQLGSFKNRCLSGAGVVYKFIQLYDEIHFEGQNYKNYEDLAAVGILADGMDVRTLDNNAIIMNGLNNIVNPMLKEFIANMYASINRTAYRHFSELSFSEIGEVATKKNVIWKIAPLINAMIRMGKQVEKLQLFMAFITLDTIEIFSSTTPRGREREETLYQLALRQCSNAQSRQSSAVLKCLRQLKDYIEENNLTKNQIIVVKVDSINIPQTLTGLVAMKLVVEYKKPVLLLRPTEEDGNIFYRGSGRALKSKGFSSLLRLLKANENVEFAEGHDMAMGVGIYADNYDAAVESLNSQLSEVDFSDEAVVDSIVTADNWDNLALKEFGETIPVFAGGGLPEAKFYFNFDTGKQNFRIQGKSGDSLKISYRGTTFVMFKCPEIVQKYAELCKSYFDIKVEAVGTVSINEWMGYRNIQIIIEALELSGVDNNELLF